MATGGKKHAMKIPDKILQYEQFLNERLKTDLRHALEERDKVVSEASEYIQLRNAIEKIQMTNPRGSLKTMVDLGANFYCQAKVEDPSKIFVAVGFGFFVEFTLSEAIVFIDKKSVLLNVKIDNLTKKISEISARTKLIVEGLRELQFGGEDADGPPHKNAVF